MDCRASLAMTQSDDKNESQERKRWRIKSAMRVKGVNKVQKCLKTR